MKKRTIASVLLGLLYFVALLVYWLHLGGRYFEPLRDSLYLFTPLTSVIAGIFLLRLYGTKGFRARTFILLTLGISCLFVGEVLWNYYEYFLHINPFPSNADIFYLTAYPLFFMGLINEIRGVEFNWHSLKRETIFLLTIVSILLIILVFYFGIYLAYDAKETLSTNIIAMGYGIGDVILILTNIFVLVLAWEFRGGKFSHTWIAIFCSFIMTLIADILFAIFTDPYKA